MAGWVAVLRADPRFPESHSLKEKRHHLRSAKAQLQNRFGAAVAETDHHDVWQRAELTAALTGRSARDVEQLAADAERWLHGQAWEVAHVDVRLVSTDDE